MAAQADNVRTIVTDVGVIIRKGLVGLGARSGQIVMAVLSDGDSLVRGNVGAHAPKAMAELPEHVWNAVEKCGPKAYRQ